MVSRYATNGPVKQDGICLLPQHPYRMMPPPQRTDIIVPGYVQPPGNQAGSQGPGLRGIAPTGPPNQASTPPNTELKVPLPQPPQMNHMFIQQRPSQGPYFQTRTAGPPTQTQRMPNHNNRSQQPVYSPQTGAQYMVPTQAFIVPNPVTYYNPQQRPPSFVQSSIPMYSGPPIAYPYNPNPQQTQLQYFYNSPAMIQRGTSMPPPQPTNPNPSQNTIPSGPPLIKPPTPVPQYPPKDRKRRPNAIAIIDPNTGVDKLNELFEGTDSSHPPSGESSTSQTPQPNHSQAHKQEVQATFAKMVFQALQEDGGPAAGAPTAPTAITNTTNTSRVNTEDVVVPPVERQHLQPSPVSNNNVHIVGGHQPQLQQQQIQQQQVPVPQQYKIEQIAQSSKLHPTAKEFVSTSPSSTAKDTPVVSANCDSVEVTLPNKLTKDRESPVKNRKARDQQQQQHVPREQLQHKDSSLKESTKDAVVVSNSSSSNSDKQSSIVREQEVNKANKETSATSSSPSSTSSSPSSSNAATNLLSQQQVPVLNKDNTIKDNNYHSQDNKMKGQRKDASNTNKSPSIEVNERVVSSPVPASQPQQQQMTQDGNCNVKSKQNAPRSNNSTKQPVSQVPQQLPQNNATTTASVNVKSVPTSVVVPPPQPSKTSNKSHKKSEINQKGANKEGTDMDAFNDNASSMEEVNANNITSNTSTNLNNDIINANSVPIVNNPTNANVIIAPIRDNDSSVVVNNETTTKRIDSNDLTIKTEPIKTIKTKIDITDIVKEKPKPIKSFVNQFENSSHDETDRASISNDKLVQAKNEVNAKSNDPLENKLPYTDGQWTPNNPKGSKVYQKDFLIALKDAPSSRMRPDNIPDVVLADERARLPDGRSSTSGRNDAAAYQQYNFGGKSSSQRGGVTQRNSKNKINDSKRKQPSLKVSISVREDVKLHETENAWRPARFTKGEEATDDDLKTEELYKKVRGVLNKLTPQKFETLLSQIKELEIDTVSRLQGVIDLVFEKAVDEPNFSVAYASMCSELALMQVPSANSTPDKPEVVNFRKLLINRCQVEFEKNSGDETIRCAKMKEIEETTDPEKKKDLQFDLEDYERRLRRKSVGNIRFIGELFKQNMLTVNIMLKCLKNLLDNKDEESLECLCKLLTTIGKELESKNVDLSQIFNAMKNIADKKDGKVSSRIRFMLQDVIDLKNSKWIPRRQDHNPKTIDQIQREADQEQLLSSQMLHSAPTPPRRGGDDRVNMGGGQGTLDRKGGGRGGGGGGGSRNNASDSDGWMTNTKNRSSNFTVQSDKLKSKAPQIDAPLGSSQMYNFWSKGSVGAANKSQPQPQPSSVGLNTTNMYAALENIDSDKRSYGPRSGSSNKDAYSSKGPSMERSYNNKYDGRGGSRSGSQHRSNDNSSSSSQRSTPAPIPPRSTMVPPLSGGAMVPQQQQNVAASAVSAGAPPTMPAVLLTEDQMERRIGSCLDEYLTGNTVEDFYLDINSVIPVSFHAKMVSFCYMRVLEKTAHARLRTGGLFAKLVKQGKVSVEDYCTGVEDILSQGDDLVIDIPKIWNYIAEILVDLLCEEALSIDRLKKLLSILTPRNTLKVLAPLFKLIVEKNGPVFLQNILKKSGVRLTDFMDSGEVDRFIQDNHLEFLAGGAAPVGENQLSYEHIQEKLLELFKGQADFDTIVNWISTNVGENVKENKFIRTLATAIFQDSIDPTTYKLVTDRLIHHVNILVRYVDNNPAFELQCLFALQALINKMEHPQGLLLSICDKLYELETFSQESFIAWEDNKDLAEQEGKGVALKQLTSFFTQLRENDEDESDESDVA